MSEAELQANVARYIRIRYPDVLFHSDFGSGVKLTPWQAKMQRAQNGGRRAWPDLFIAEPIYEEVEQWKDIRGYEGAYKISDHARVKRIVANGEHFIKAQTHTNGYCYVHLCKGNKVKAYRLHRLVAEAFVPNFGNKPHVNHLDGDKTNNRYDNLEWVTASENQKHSRRVLGNKGGKPVRPIKCIETGETYDSIAEAVIKTGITHISAVVRGERKTAGGYRWQGL